MFTGAPLSGLVVRSTDQGPCRGNFKLVASNVPVLYHALKGNLQGAEGFGSFELPMELRDLLASFALHSMVFCRAHGESVAASLCPGTLS